MKLRTLILIAISLYGFHAMSQVEINAGSPNAELEIISKTKGILLPRLNNPAAVNSPEEGLLIYDKTSKSPAYHDGVNWNMMMPPMMTNVNDSLTYTIVGPGGVELNLSSISGGGSSGEDKYTFNISKLRDVNSILFIRKFLFDSGHTETVPTIAMGVGPLPINLLVNVYQKNTTSPYFSFKFTEVSILAYSNSFASNDINRIESYTIDANIVGWKDWVTGETVAIGPGKKFVPY